MLFSLMAWVSSEGAERWPRWRRLLVLLAEGLVTYLPVIVLGQVWASMAGFFAGSALLLLSAWAGWAVFAATVGSIFIGGLVMITADHGGVYSAAYLGLSTTVLGLVVFGLARLWHAIRYLGAARSELAQLAVVTERMRFARDLHDLLGYSLSAITLKAELTRRLVGSNPARARDELAEILDTARQALADVRVVASGYRSISLAKEASSVASLLAAAGIDARVEIACGIPDEQIDTALATVLREAVTNLLRHSTARNCTIEASVAGDEIRLLITNDGVPGQARVGRPGGGLESLSLRMTAIGGDVAARIRGDGRFEVLAHAPLMPPSVICPAPQARLPAHRWRAVFPAPGESACQPRPNERRGENEDREAAPPAISGGLRLARVIMLAVYGAYTVNLVINALTWRAPVHRFEAAADITAVVTLLALSVWASSEGAERWPRWRRLLVLLAEGLVTYLPVIVLGQVWGSMAGFFAGSALLLLSAWAGWAVFAGAFASMIVTAVAWNLGTYTAAYLGLSTTVLGLVVFGLARLWHAIRYLGAARSELAQLAVVTERMRFARDLHDLLGYSLSAITLKAELTRRLVGSNPARARDELAEILDTARQALADVRLVASGYRGPGRG